MKYSLTSKTKRLISDHITIINDQVYLDRITGKFYITAIDGTVTTDNVLRLSTNEPLLLVGGEEILLGPA